MIERELHGDPATKRVPEQDELIALIFEGGLEACRDVVEPERRCLRVRSAVPGKVDRNDTIVLGKGGRDQCPATRRVAEPVNQDEHAPFATGIAVHLATLGLEDLMLRESGLEDGVLRPSREVDGPRRQVVRAGAESHEHEGSDECGDPHGATDGP
jgi:hypothetical protein